uniref:Phosphatidylcholine-sterol acyltransferase n=1 Tax=Sinocyclocheilus anshuiensis TaxID=1608454 RepID=A0A671N1S5_9TELE
MGHSRSFTCVASLLIALHQTSGFWLFNVIFPPTAKPLIINNSTPPLIIVPGNLGNRLEAKIDKPTLVHWMCYKKTEDWFPLWIDLNMFMPIGIDCWVDNIRIVYNRTTRKTSNAPGVEVRVPGFGQTHPIEFLDLNKLTGYFHTMVQHLVSIGYVRNETVRGAPYDWRIQCFLVSLIQLQRGRTFPETFQKCKYFLKVKKKSWKVSKRISNFSRNLLKIFDLYAISGENDGIPFVSNIKIREEQRMTTTNPWMIPSEEAWSRDHTFISTPFFNYTNQDYQQFFKDIDFEDGWYMWEDTKNLTAGLPPPGVEVYCLYGVGLPTPVTYVYDEQFPNADPIDIIYDDGDDTVGSRSMSLCKRWMGKQEQAVHVTEVRGMDHLDMVFNHKVLTAIQRILEGKYHEKTSDSSEDPPSLSLGFV